LSDSERPGKYSRVRVGVTTEHNKCTTASVIASYGDIPLALTMYFTLRRVKWVTVVSSLFWWLRCSFFGTVR
jgi:hypothetical protein